MGLEEYWRKRDFVKTPEPRGRVLPRRGRARYFCVQEHAASHLHYDFRLELEGVLKSWAVPKGPSLDPTVRRLAMQTEDHPFDYGDFEGIIPKGQYGGGTVLLWDAGTWIPLDDDPHQALRAGKLKFEMRGEKLRGAFVLSRGGPTSKKESSDRGKQWMLIKLEDEHAAEGSDVVREQPRSVTTGRDLARIAADADRVWQSNRGRRDDPMRAELVAEERDAKKRAAKLPARIAATKRSSAKKVPTADTWLHAIAVDGVPVLARIEGGTPTLRRGTRDVSHRFPAVLRALRRLHVAAAVIEGTVSVLRPDGGTEQPRETDTRATLFAEDLLHVEGEDLRRAPARDRIRALDDLVTAAGQDPALRTVRWFEARGAEIFERACALGAKAVWSRRGDTPFGAGIEVIACGRVAHAGVKPDHLSKPTKVLWPATKTSPAISKRELAEYYAAIADAIVPHLRGRPLTLVRAAKSIADGTAYMRHSKVWGPGALRRIPIAEKNKIGEYLLADSIEAVLGLVQMSIVEIHTWNCVDPEIERPDRVIFDLDPDPSVPWKAVVDAARLLRRELAAIGHEGFVKTTGGKGLHVVVPLVPQAGWTAALDFTRAFSEAIVRSAPATFTTLMPKARRRGKILIDYLRNNRGNTSVAAFSTRAKPGAPVSMPISWTELGRVDPSAFTLHTVPRILARRRRDPWSGYEAARRPLDSRR